MGRGSGGEARKKKEIGNGNGWVSGMMTGGCMLSECGLSVGNQSKRQTNYPQILRVCRMYIDRA